MKKILLSLIMCILVGCTNAPRKDSQEIQNYIKDIDAKIEAEFNTNPRKAYPKPLSEEEARKNPLIWREYVEVVIENVNGTVYKNVYSAYDNHLIASVPLGDKGKPYGVYKKFHKNGNLAEIVFVDKGGVYSGTKREYYPSGKLYKLIPYYKNSVEGDRIFYFENGQVQEIYRYVNNKEDGEGRINYENGQPKLIETYKNGKKEGPYKIYDPMGRLRQKGVNKDGKAIPDEEF